MSKNFLLSMSTEKLALSGQQASAKAISELKAKGIPISHLKDGKIHLEYADGKIEVIDCDAASEIISDTTLPNNLSVSR